MKPKTEVEETVFSPSEASTLAVESVEERRRHLPGLPTGIPGLDDVMLPMKRGELIVVEGYTSNGKSLVMSAIANHALQFAQDRDVVLYISWEQSIEEQTILDISRMCRIDCSAMYRGNLDEVQWKVMMRAAIDRMGQPLWLIGHSDASDKRRPRMGMTEVAVALDYLVDVQKRKPILIVLDYLQRINRDGEKQRDARIAYMNIVDRVKDMALAFTCPVLLGVQAGRQVLDRKWQMPEIHDGQETSNIEQSSDKFISVWMPKTSQEIGSTLTIPGSKAKTPVTPNLLLLSLLKQKFGEAPKLLALYARPEIGQLHRLDLDSGHMSI
jgi:replicative DNA helicase